MSATKAWATAIKRAALLGGSHKMLTRFAAALNQPIDAVANRKNRKASAGNGPWGSLGMAGRAIASASILAGLCRWCS
jgi:hypothetical protein